MSRALTSVEIFCSYAYEDETWLRKLDTHLSLLQQQGLISLWHDRLIVPGTDWTKSIDTHLDSASVILLLVSADFFASDYCYGIEMQRALARQEAGEACVIPILVRPVDWKGAPFKHLRVLPLNGTPITQWRNRDEALTDVARGIRNAIEGLPASSKRAPSSSRPPLWRVPPARNPFFTGREEYLRQISTLLGGETPTSAVAPLALCGLGGIGKTQIAVEYAYRHRSNYQAIFWVEAASYETLTGDFLALASVLKLVGTHTQHLLPKKSLTLEKTLTAATSKQRVPVQPLFTGRQQEGLVKLFQAEQQKLLLEAQTQPEASQESGYLIGAVKHWFDTQTNWLLIFDNVEELKVVEKFLPLARGGHILLTTRSQSPGELAQSIAVEKMEFEEGICFLLRRMKVVPIATRPPSTSEATHTLAGAIAQELDNMPLALDQAGAYIEETGCGLAGYLDRYRKRRIQLLRRRGGENPPHPEPIATTVSLCFENVEKESPVAANILRLCAFLHSSGAPEEFIAIARFDPLFQSVAVDLLQLDAAIEVLRKFSLIDRISDTKTLVVHRLVQVILRDAMDEGGQREWTERAVRLVSQVLSDGQSATWQAYFPHVQSCAELVMQQKLCMPEAAQLFHQVGAYLKEQLQYEQATQLLQQAIAIWEQLLQQDPFALMSSLDTLAEIHVTQGQYDEALPLLQRTLSLREQVLGTDHFKIASNLDNLATIYSAQGKYQEAQELFERELAIREQVLGEEHLDLVNTLNHLALLHMEQEHDAEAELLLQRILVICTRVLGPNHPDTSRASKNYADLLQRTGRSSEAEALAKVRGSPASLPVIWNIPYARNPFFSGRELELAHLREHFQRGQTNYLSQPLALSGLSGIGKTQLALEYAYRYRNEYQTVLWVQGDTREKMLAGVAALATILNLEEQHEKEQQRIVGSVKSWLRKNAGWLLIIDNIEDLGLVPTLLPAAAPGHILLTTRTQTTGTIAQRIDLDKMTLEEGALFLLRRTEAVAPDASLQDASTDDCQQAKALAEALDGLPLALDQAGAYIEEVGCNLTDYLVSYQAGQMKLLAMRGAFAFDHPASVAGTFSSLFEEVEKISSTAMELSRLCAFLHPEGIPEELIVRGAAELGPALQGVAADPLWLDETIVTLRRFSLVSRRAGTNMLSVHRLVQTVLQNRMHEQTRRMWAERTVRAINRALPDLGDFSMWQRCQLYMLHVQKCVDLIEEWKIVSPEAARLLEQAGIYLQVQAQYAQARALFERAAKMRTPLAEASPATTVAALGHHFWDYYYQGQYGMAEQPIREALGLLVRIPGANRQLVAVYLGSAANLLYRQGKYSQAEEYFLEALTIYEQRVGLQHPSVVCTFSGLGNVSFALGKYDLAEKFFRHALNMWKQMPEPQHPLMADCLSGLARLCLARGKYAQAELYLRQERAHLEQALRYPHPALANSLNEQALLSMAQGKYKEVEPLLGQALAILEQSVGLQHPIVGCTLDTLGRLAYLQGEYVSAERFLQRALSVREQTLGVDHPDVLCTVSNLADVYMKQSKLSIAQELYKDILAARTRILGARHPAVAQTLQSMAHLASAYGEQIDAEQL